MASYEKNKAKLKPSKVIIYIVLILLAIMYVAPLIWVIMASLKSNTVLFTDPFGLPNPPQWVNYETAWVGGKIGRYFLNSVIVVGITLVRYVHKSWFAGFLCRFDSAVYGILIRSVNLYYAWLLWQPAKRNGGSSCY